MARRITSAELVGRAAELSAIRAAMAAAAAGQSRIVLVSGDAGIGKTRLVQAACAQAVQDRYGASVGGCVQLGEVPLAYAPVVELLRGLRDELGEDRLAELAPPALTGLLGGTAPASSGQLFTPVLDFLTRLGRWRPWLVAFEDLHWADASTRDLIAFLGRNLRRAPVTLVLTYRSDELHRRHPLRPLLADLERLPDTERIGLPGLGRAELVELLIGLGRDDLDLAGVSALLTRTGGNPLFVEELVAATPPTTAAGATGQAGLPATLSEVILTRVGRLSSTAQAVLRQAAVIGTDLDDRLLGACADLPAGQITEALREAIGAQLLVLDAGGGRFRHALLAEALYEDLLPGERVRVHAAAARALAAGEHAPDLPEHTRAAMLAHHWNAAHDLPQAFAASVRAGSEALRVSAHAAAAGHLERAIELWDRVPDPAGHAGMDRAALLLLAAEAVHYSRSPRQLTLVDAAYQALDPAAEPERRAAVLTRVAHFYWDLEREADATAAYQQAVRLLVGRPPSPERALALAELGQFLMTDEHPDAEATLRDAVTTAEAVGAYRAEALARCSLGVVEAELGRVDEGVASMRQALRLSLAHGSRGDIARCHANLAAALLRAGAFEEVAAACAEGLAYCAQAGQLDLFGGTIAAHWVTALTNAGRWAEAVRVESELAARRPGGEDSWYYHASRYLATRRLLRLLWAGDYPAAAPEIERLLALTADTSTPYLRGVVLFRAGELAAGQRRFDDARSACEAGLATCDRRYGQSLLAHGLALAIGVEADRVEATHGSGPHVDAEVAQARETADRLAERVAGLRARVGESLSALLPEPAGWLAVADAEQARLRRMDTSPQWQAVAEEWLRLGMPYPEAVARWRAAAAALREGGGRAAAAQSAGQAVRIAESIGAARLATEIGLLARRGRLDLPTTAAPHPEPPPDPLARLGVTRREAEVLTLLAAGRTNRQIAAALYISEKTASVHVTNLLRKLGVSNRIEAAAVAQRLGPDEADLKRW